MSCFVIILFYFRIQNTAAYSSDALKHKEAPMVENEVILSDHEVQERQKLSGLVTLPKEVLQFISRIFQRNNNLRLISENFGFHQWCPRGTRQRATRSYLYSSQELYAKRHQQPSDVENGIR